MTDWHLILLNSWQDRPPAVSPLLPIHIYTYTSTSWLINVTFTVTSLTQESPRLLPPMLPTPAPLAAAAATAGPRAPTTRAWRSAVLARSVDAMAACVCAGGCCGVG